jgi:glycerophosphoryl diester phosphodiesterase
MTTVTKEMIDGCHKRNIKIVVWTVNKPEDMQKLIALGADGIISDYPNLFERLNHQE